MAAIGWLRARYVELAWLAFAAANLAAMLFWPSWETIPFHFIWISLTLVYGFRVWTPGATGLVILATGSLILSDAFNGEQLWGELFEVPLMSAMFLAMVWHARRRQDTLRILERESAERAALLGQQKRFLHDVSHELRTPVTIARGHLELLRRLDGKPAQEIDIALDELGRIENILERLLLLAKSKQPDFVVPEQVEIEPFLEDVLVRWSGIVPRGWRLGELSPGMLHADQVHRARRRDHAFGARLRPLAADRGRRRGSRAAGGRSPADLRPLRPRRLGPVPRPGRRGPRARDRRRDREGTRRRMLRAELRRRRGLHAALAGLRSVSGCRVSLPSRPRRSQLTPSSASSR